jgi:co-chaperonin GroES (HSP10)
MIEVFGDKVVVVDLEHGERKTKSGIILRDDDGKTHGIRPRWAKVYCKGEKAIGIEEGQWILIEHGRWSHKFKEKDENDDLRDFWLVDYNSILSVSDERLETFIVNDSY